jgi:hypothetical protein
MIRTWIFACLLLASTLANAVGVTARVVADDYFKVFVGDAAGTALTEVGGSGSTLWPGQGAPFNFNVNAGQYLYVAAWDSASYGPPHMWIGEFDIGVTKLVSNTKDWVSKFDATIKNPSTGQVQSLAQSSSSWEKLAASMPDDGNNAYGRPLIPGSSANLVWHDTFGGASASENGYALFRSAAPVPEPETYAMMMAGLGLMGFIARRRKIS